MKEFFKSLFIKWINGLFWGLLYFRVMVVDDDLLGIRDVGILYILGILNFI